MSKIREFWNAEQGLIISAELVLILTIGVLGMIVGVNGVASSVSGELNDLSSAFGTIDQSFAYRGLQKSWHAAVAGAAFVDSRDACDCTIMVHPRPIPHGDSYFVPAEPGVIPLPAPAPEPYPGVMPGPLPAPGPDFGPCTECPPALPGGDAKPSDATPAQPEPTPDAGKTEPAQPNDKN